MDNYKIFEIREGLIFLIELSDSIFQPLEELGYRSQLQEILTSINELLLELIITSHSTGVGIYFYNSQSVSKKFKPESGVSQFFGLNDINSKNMKLLNDLLENDETGIRGLKKALPPIDEASVTEAVLPVVLNYMLTEFNSKSHFNNKKLIWVTTDDNPYNSDNVKRRLWKIINDYDEYNIMISPIFLNKYVGGEVKEFNLEKFQNIFLNSGGIKSERNEEVEEEDEEDGLNEYIKKQVKKAKVNRTTLSSKIKSIILRLKEIKRIQFTCDLILSDGNEVGGNLGCSVKGYSMYNHEKPKRYESIYNKGELSKIVQVKTKYVDEQTSESIAKQEPTKSAQSPGGTRDGDKATQTKESSTSTGEWVKGYPIGEEDVLYLNEKQLLYMKNYHFDHTPEEKSADAHEIIDEIEPSIIQTFSKPPYLKLLGFRKVSRFQPYFNTSNPIFVTPDLHNGLRTSTSVGGYQNSFTTFSSLYQSCVSLKRFAVLFGCIKKNSIPCLFALYPTRIENSTKFYGQTSLSLDEFPHGFFLIRLPWIEDIRSIPEYILRENSQYIQTETKVNSNESFQNLVSQYKLIFNEFGLLNYQPRDFPNPTLNYFYKILRMHLLQIEQAEIEQPSVVENDATVEKLIDLHKYIYENLNDSEPRGLLLKNLNNSLNTLINSELNNKRNDEGEGDNDSKRIKKEVILTDKDIVTAWKNDSWSFFNVSQLRSFISNHKQITKATRRSDMIENIKEFLEKKHGKIQQS